MVPGNAGKRGLLPVDDVGGVIRRRLDVLSPCACRHERARPLEQRLERQRSGPGTLGRRSRKHVERGGPHQAVAGHEVMIEKRERPICGQRRQPQRKLRQLHRHRVAVDSEQASARDQTTGIRAIGLRQVALRGVATLLQRTLPFGGQEAAGRYQECAAAHRRIQYAERQNLAPATVPPRAGPSVSRTSVSASRAGRVEGAGGFARRADGWAQVDCGRCGRPARAGRARNRLEVQQALVDRAEFLHAKFRVCDALSTVAGPRACETQRLERPGHTPVIERQVVEQRRACRREEAPVERRDVQIPRLGTRVSEPRDRLKRCPRSPRRARLGQPGAKRIDAVAAAINGVPHRHQLSRLGKQEKQRAVDGRQGVGVARLQIRPAPRRFGDGGGKRAERVADAFSQRAADAAAVCVGAIDPPRKVAVGSGHERRRAGQTGQPRQRRRIARAFIEIEVDEPAALAAQAVNKTKREPVGDEQPPVAERQSGARRFSRLGFGAAIRHDDEGDRVGARGYESKDQRMASGDRDRTRRGPSEPLDERAHSRREDMCWMGRRPKSAPDRRAQRAVRARRRQGHRLAIAAGLTEILGRQQWPGQRRWHVSPPATRGPRRLHGRRLLQARSTSAGAVGSVPQRQRAPPRRCVRCGARRASLASGRRRVPAPAARVSATRAPVHEAPR